MEQCIMTQVDYTLYMYTLVTVDRSHFTNWKIHVHVQDAYLHVRITVTVP
jgi:hypothetical protein